MKRRRGAISLENGKTERRRDDAAPPATDSSGSDASSSSSSSEEESDWMIELDHSLTQEMNAQQARVKFLHNKVLVGDLLRVILSFSRELGSARRTNYRFLTFCTDEIRGRARGLLERAFGNVDVAGRVEHALFEYKVHGGGSCSSSSRSLGLSGKIVRNYSHSLRSLRRNLSDRNNSLKGDVLSGAILLEDLVRMAPSELASNALKQERAKQKQMAQDKRRISDELRHYKSGSKTDRFLCNRCGSRRSMYRFVYKNNSHHSSRTIVHCLDCQHKYQHFGLIPSSNASSNSDC
jgi:DNA-directed RNA polymerase subunit M/transcription elongation factor TFIIS